jgi:hypothetical protein
MNENLKKRIARLERQTGYKTCPCGRSTYVDMLWHIKRMGDGEIPMHTPGRCEHCGGPLPKIPLEVVQRIAAADPPAPFEPLEDDTGANVLFPHWK